MHEATCRSFPQVLLPACREQISCSTNLSRGFQRVHPFSFGPGLPSTNDSKFIKQLRELQESECIDRIPLIPSTPEEMADMLKLCSYVRFKVPQQVRSKKGILGWEWGCFCPALPSSSSLLPPSSGSTS